MNRNLAFKIGTIALLALLLLIPLQMIDGVIEERQSQRQDVVNDIARSSAYAQQIVGPLLVVPYRKTVREQATSAVSGARYEVQKEVEGKLYFLPETFDLNGNVQTEVRSRGIYQARLYHADNKISGHFQLPAQWGVSGPLADYRFSQPYLAVGISDIRGIENALKLSMNGQIVAFQPGSQLDILGSGVHAKLPIATDVTPPRLDFSFDLKLQGTSQLTVAPIGRETSVHLTSDWPHPSFIGEFLPHQRDVNDNGFNALWRTSFFSTNMEEQLRACAQGDKPCLGFRDSQFGVSLIDPVDQYLKSDRAIKYALLFIALTFAGFFLLEVLKKLAVHAIQYGLVGMALAFFYLLLLSLSEHIGFGLAYVASSSACVLLIAAYVSSVLHSVLRGISFGAGLAALYGLLFGLLSAEDYALLMGSLLLFGLLGLFMMLTRKVDWFNVSRTTVPA